MQITANTAGISKGISETERVIRALGKGADSAAKDFDKYRDAAGNLPAALQQVATDAGFLASEFRRGLRDAADFAKNMQEVEAEALRLGAAFSEGASVTEKYATDEEKAAAATARLSELLSVGAISAETYARAVADADGTNQAAADSLAAWNAKQAEADAITKANLSAQEKYDQALQTLQGHLDAGRISQETFNAAQAKAQADLDKAGSGADNASKKIDSLAKSSDKAAGSLRILAVIEIGKAVIAGAQALAGAIQGVIGKVVEATQKYDALNDVAQRTGVSVEALASFNIAGQLAGVEDISGAITKLGVEIGQAADPKKAKAFEDIGLSFAELQTLSPEDQFRKVQAAIAALPTEAERAAAAVAIFGKSGAELVPVFTSGFAQIEERAKRLGIVLTEDQVGAIDELYDSLTLVQATFDGIIAQVGANLAPVVTGIAEEFLSFVENFQSFDGGAGGGTGIADVITNALFDGAEFLAGVFDAAVQSLNDWVNYFAGPVKTFETVSAIFDFVGKLLYGAFKVFETAGNLLAAALGAFLEGLGSWVSSDLESAGKQLKDTAIASANANVRALNSISAGGGGAQPAARQAGAAESFVERQRARYDASRGPEAEAKRAQEAQKKLDERLTNTFASAEAKAKEVFGSTVPDSIKEGIAAAGEEVSRVLEMARADGNITEEEAKRVAEAQLKYNQAIQAGQAAMAQAEKDAKKRAELEEKYSEKALEIETARLEGLRNPANKANEGADIRSSEGIAEYIRLATGREDPAVAEYKKQLGELQKIRKEINKVGVGKANIAA